MQAPLTHDLLSDVYMGNVFLQGFIAGIMFVAGCYLLWKSVAIVIRPIRYLPDDEESRTLAIEAVRQFIHFYERWIERPAKEKGMPAVEEQPEVVCIGDDGEMIFEETDGNNTSAIA